MNKKIIIVFFILIVLIIGGILIYKNISVEKVDENSNLSEYTPEQEMSDEDLRKTIVSLYFNNKETNTLMPEARLVDVKILAENPYEELIKLLIQGPKSEKLERVIPEGTILNNAKIIGDVVYIDFSKEFIENHTGGAEAESKTIYSILNTLIELNEVNEIKILIDGEENKAFNDNAINFNNNFVKIN